jgi:hypothetical protein
VKKKVALLFTALSAHMRPPCRVMMRWTVDSGALELAGRVQPLDDAEELVGVVHVETGAVVANEEDGAALLLVDAELDTVDATKRRPQVMSYRVCERIELPIGGLQLGDPFAPLAGELYVGANPGQQLRRGERLDQIVIRAGRYRVESILC